jgi:hypothetical protein
MGTDVKHSNPKLRMFPASVTPTCVRLVDIFADQDYISQFHLVGGTSLAVQLEHSLSEDLDFFSMEEFNPLDWKLPENFQITKINENYLRGEWMGTKCDFVFFAYPPHYDFIEWRGLKLLAADDIGLFKLLALTGRNRKKDIVDLYFIDKMVKPLSEVIHDFFTRYHRSDVNDLKKFEQLFNDEAIENSQMPIMLKPFDWDTGYAEVKQKILAAIKAEIGIELPDTLTA